MVALSSVGGAGWQFFDANGDPLSGGKIYTYEAGTTTPATTYTDSTGGTANSNPIILDSSGRVSGQIWLENSTYYKFVLTTSTNVTVWTKDNLPGIFSSAILSASSVDYLPPFANAVTSNYTVSDKLSQVISVMDFGAAGDGITDDSEAIQAAVNVLFASPKGGTLYFPAGDYLINTTINLNDFNATALNNLPVLYTKGFRIAGDGSGATRFVGGEPGYGFFELIGANLLQFEGFSVVSTRSTNLPQFGMVGGRKTGDGSSGLHSFTDVYIMGRFSKCAMFMLSSEVNTFSSCIFYPQIGHGCIMAMNNLPWGVTPKYGAFGSGLGGNGANKFYGCQFLSATLASASDVLLALEYAQAFQLNGCYWASSNNLTHVFLRKSASGIVNDCFFERYGSFDPYSIYFAPDDPSDVNDYIDYRDITVTNCRLLRIFSESPIRITNMTLENSVFRGNAAGTVYHIDLAKVYDSRFDVSNRLPNVTLVTDVKMRIREENQNNYYSGFNSSSLEAPFLSLDTVQLTTTDSVELSSQIQGGLNTVPGAAVANSGAYAQIAAGSVPGTNAFSLLIDFDCPSTIDANVRMLCGLGGSSSNLGAANTMSIYVANGRLWFRSFGPASANESTYGTTDPSFVAKFSGKRCRLVVVRDGAVPIAYLNGYRLPISLVFESGGRTWAGTITANYLLIGFQSTSVSSNASTAYHSAALFNYALTAARAAQLTTTGLSYADQWGSVFGGGVNGCIGYWDFESGGGTSIFDQSPFTQHGTITGTVSRNQNAVKRVFYRTNVGSPSGVLTPSFIGEEVLDTTGSNWYKATGLANTNWKVLT